MVNKDGITGLAIASEFSRLSNGNKLRLYEQQAVRHDNNVVPMSMLLKTIAQASGGKQLTEKDTVELKAIKEAVYREFGIMDNNGRRKVSDAEFKLAEKQMSLENIAQILKNLQENSEVWKVYDPNNANAVGHTKSGGAGATTP
jgi:uncharacterized protein (DUF2267 family)